MIEFQYIYPYSRQPEIIKFLEKHNYDGGYVERDLFRRSNALNKGVIKDGNSWYERKIGKGRGTPISFNVFKYILEIL